MVVLVMGLPRTGTSCIAGILNIFNFNMGDEYLPTDEEWCAKGFYADLEFHIALEKYWFTRSGEELRQLIERKNGKGITNWGVKSHLLCAAIEHFIDIPNLVVITTNRDNRESLDSWVTRNGGIGQEIFDEFTVAMESAVSLINRNNIPLLTIDFDNLINKPEKVIKDIHNFLNKSSNEEPDINIKNNSVNFIEPSLVRFNYG